MVWNLPNILTWLRILAIPLIVLLFLFGARNHASLAYRSPACCSPPPRLPIRSTATWRVGLDRSRASALFWIRLPTSSSSRLPWC